MRRVAFLNSALLLLTNMVYGQGCPADALTFPAEGHFPVLNNTTAYFAFNANAGDQIAVRAEGYENSNPILTLRFWSRPSVTVIGPTGTVLASEAGTVVHIPASGALTLPTSGRHCLRIDVTGGREGWSILFVGVSGQQCTTVDLPGDLALAANEQQIGLYALLIPGCSYAVVSDSPWIQPTTAPPGPGFSRIAFRLPDNFGPARTGTLKIGSQQITISQAAGASAGCTYSLTNLSLLVPAEGGAGTENLNATPGGGCAFLLKSSAPWLSLNPPLTGTVAAAHPVTWTAAPNFSTQPRTAVVNAANKELRITQAGNTSPETARYIQMLYWSFFGRVPTTSEVDFHQRSGLSRAAIALSFFNSAEFVSGGLYVAGLYVGLLNRDPEYSGWLWQRLALVGRAVTKQQLVSNFLSSPEYHLAFAMPAHDLFVRQMYRQVLGREPSDPEVSYHLAFFLNGGTRAALAQNFLDSAEFAGKTLPRLHSSILYFTLLNRDAASWERESVRQQLSGGKTLLAAVTEFVNSSELALILK